MCETIKVHAYPTLQKEIEMNESDVRKQEWVKVVSRSDGGYVRVRNEQGDSYYTHISNLMAREQEDRDTVST